VSKLVLLIPVGLALAEVLIELLKPMLGVEMEFCGTTEVTGGNGAVLPAAVT